ncbi:phosphoglyceromutase [Lutibacter sp. B1]|uniref:phosphoglyceromutase n=1 Tax=Lutibacter sp. B1 TaxID=2725996 RepID=UPI0014572E12|nr:phosphoglyceromutase [Lutibacter sp. B1]NLP57090.1 phosphoglyceromutase [Lutibacter sp. B1]
MKKISLIISIILLLSFIGNAQQKTQKSEPNIFVITLDGVRWQEVFTGIDTVLLENKKYTHDKKVLSEKFIGESIEENRKKLMPFFWNTIVKEGQIYGNRNKNSFVNLTNKMVFSYPGYNEILTGKADDATINSNDKIYNKNITVLEKINQNPQYKNKVAAFGSWDVFPFIINDKRSGIPVNAGYMKATGDDLTEREIFLNEIQWQAPIIWESVRLDVFTHQYAKEYIKKKQPKVVYIAYGETDDFAHGGLFDYYIKSLYTADSMIEDLWNYVQNNPFYKNNTYFIITTDHGRGVGDDPESMWTSHGSKVKDADQTWLAVMGPTIKAKGEIKEISQNYTNQIAATVAKLLGLDNLIDDKIGKPFISNW